MMTKKMSARIARSKACAIAAGLAIGLVSHADAGTLTCAGTVQKLAFHAPGRLMLQLSDMNTPVFICSTDGDWVVADGGYVTTPSACKALYSTFLAARVSGGSINYIHFDGAQVPATCSSWPAWANATVRYFGY